MSRISVIRYAATPVLLLGLASPALLQGCSDDLGCDPQLGAKFEALNTAVNSLVKVTGEIKGSLAVACAGIATDLGGTPPDVGNGADVSDDDLTAACDAASLAVDAELKAGASVTVAIEGGECTVNAEAQFSCEASCDVNGECTPGSVTASCDPGELSVKCGGSCEVNAVCKGSVEVAANCEGTCSGNCNGTCDGNTTDGAVKCNGECKGTCTGECKITASGGIDCGAEAKCKGGCSGTATLPTCEGEIKPPECKMDADCQAGCDGQAKFEASCTEPKVTVVVTGTANANLGTTLEANLPKVFKAAGQLELVASAAGDVADAFVSATQAIATAPACVLEFGSDFAGSIAASAEASVSVSVSVEASASVSGKAGG